jgi:putative phage-type endonuclease
VDAAAGRKRQEAKGVNPAISDRQQFHDDRRNGIGGTDIAAIMGANPWKTRYDVYCEKKGIALAERVETERMRWGTKLQRIIAEEYGIQTGYEVEWFDRTIRHPVRTWQSGTPDAFCVEPDKPGIDCKNVGLSEAWQWGEPGTDEIPLMYTIQNQWYLSLTSRPSWDNAVLLGGNEFRIYHTEPDWHLQDTLLEEGEKFWEENICADNPPEIDGSASAFRYLAARYPRQIYQLRDASEDEIRLLVEYKKTREAIDSLLSDKEVMENRIRQAIGDADGIVLPIPGARPITWRRSKDGKKVDYESIVPLLLERIENEVITDEGVDGLIQTRKLGQIAQEVISQFTVPRPGTRRLVTSYKKWSYAGDETEGNICRN